MDGWSSTFDFYQTYNRLENPNIIYKKNIKKNSYATYENFQSRLKERAFYSQPGVSIDVGLLSENHHKISLIASEDLLLNEGVVPFCGLL